MKCTHPEKTFKKREVFNKLEHKGASIENTLRQRITRRCVKCGEYLLEHEDAEQIHTSQKYIFEDDKKYSLIQGFMRSQER